MGNWIPRTFDEACRRAAGRRRYLAQRREIQSKRQHDVLRALQAQEWLKEGWQSYGVGRTLAKQLNVSEATISRDLRHFMTLRLNLGEHAQGAFDLMLRERPTRDDSSTQTLEKGHTEANAGNYKPEAADLDVVDEFKTAAIRFSETAKRQTKENRDLMNVSHL